MKNKIEKIVIEQVQDESPDTSYIGKYTDNAEPWAIVRQGEHAGKYTAELPEDAELPERSREYRYFIPYAGGEKAGTAEYKTYGLQDFEQFEALNRGDWYFMGIIAKATIRTVSGVSQVIRSGGLWGVQSNSGKEYLEEVAQAELSSLKDELEALGQGFGKRALLHAFKNVETVTK